MEPNERTIMEFFLNSLVQSIMFVVLVASIFVILVLGKNMFIPKDWKNDPSKLD